jgi:hypothetical protein
MAGFSKSWDFRFSEGYLRNRLSSLIWHHIFWYNCSTLLEDSAAAFLRVCPILRQVMSQKTATILVAIVVACFSPSCYHALFISSRTSWRFLLFCDASIVTYYIVTVSENDSPAVGRCPFSLSGLQRNLWWTNSIRGLLMLYCLHTMPLCDVYIAPNEWMSEWMKVIMKEGRQLQGAK